MGRLKQELSKLADWYHEEIIRQMSAEKLVATGGLKDSIKKDVNEYGFEISSSKEYSYLLGNFGRMEKRGEGYQGRNRIERIRQWVRAKGIRPSRVVKTSGMRRFRRGGTKGSVAEDRMVYAISGGISKNGTAKRFLRKYGTGGSRIIQDATNKMKAKGYQSIAEAYKEDLIQGIKQEFKFDNIKIQ
jgi:hypothetical protein